MKIVSLIAISAALVLSACGKPETPTVSSEIMVPLHTSGSPATPVAVICLSGVKYWIGHKRMAPYINPETLQFEKCSVEKQL